MGWNPNVGPRNVFAGTDKNATLVYPKYHIILMMILLTKITETITTFYVCMDNYACMK